MNKVYNPQHFDNLLDHIRACSSKTPKKAVAYLEENVVPYLNKKLEKAAGTEKKFFETTHNLVTSYRDGLKNGDIEIKDLRGLRADMVKAKSEHEQKVAKAVEAAAKKAKVEAGLPKGLGPDPDGHKDPEWMGDWMKGNGGISTEDEAMETNRIFKKYSVFKKVFPKNTFKPYVAVRAPVLVIPHGIPNFEKLARTGVCEDSLFGYPILKNQVLVGMSHDWLKENFARKAKVNLLSDGKKDFTLDYAGALKKITDDIKERTGRSYIYIDGVHAFDSIDLHWAWLISDVDMRRLAGTTSGSSTFSPKDWTLPFEHTVQKLRPRSK